MYKVIHSITIHEVYPKISSMHSGITDYHPWHPSNFVKTHVNQINTPCITKNMRRCPSYIKMCINILKIAAKILLKMT